ncbi:MAG: hypothetical protein KH301_05370 [Brachyspira sp.]|nr:hypothetical protein [Brachyspira sp.]
MAIEVSTAKLNTIITSDASKKQDSELTVPETNSSNDAWLLSITARYNKDALTQVERVMSTNEVIDGTVAAEIDKIIAEEDQINAVLKENTNALNADKIDTLQQSLRATTAKTIGFVKYTGKSKINAKTDTASIKNSIVANNAAEKKLIEDSIDVMCEWLDDYIANYNVRVAQGNMNGDSEVKLSFLLEARKAIENCDFKVGFGTVGTGQNDNFTPDDTTMGSYNPSMLMYNNGTLVGYDTYHLNGPDRNILLNPSYFMPDRKYSNVDEIKAAIQAGTTSFNPVDLLVDEAAYNNYCKTNLAATLWHELIHSTHIYNEYVTYFATDAYEDDIANKEVEGFSVNTLNFLKQAFPGFANGVTYESVGVTHYFDNYNDVVDFAWDAIQNNKEAFDLYMPGVSKAEFESELKNFIA